MTPKERLVELIKDEIDCDKAGIIPEWLADYLLAEGVIVPPCKIGTKVFFITFDTTDEKTEYFLCEGVIESFCLEGSGLWAHGRYTNGLTFWHKEDSFGINVFFDKEEAEKALAERYKQ